ncbi:G-box binding factor, partial [Bonamia ostreae]
GETYVKESWNNIIFMTMCLSTLKILPEKTFDSEDFKTANGKTFPSLKKSIHSSNKQKSGFFAFFSSTKSDKIKSSEESFNRKTDKIMENLQLEKILQISFRRTSLSTICKVLTSILLDKSIKDVFSYNICRFLNESECIIFCLDRLSDLAERNRSHFDVLWPVIREDLFKILQNMNNVDYLTERAVVNALRIFIVYASIDVPVPTTNNNIDEKNGGRLVQISNTSEMAKILTNLISIDAKLLSFFYDRFVSFLIVLTNVYDYKPFIPPETEVFFAFLAKLAILDKSKTDLILVVDKILSEKIDSKVVLTSADLVVVLSEKTEKLDFKSVEILKKNLEKLSDKRKFVQKEKRNGFLKQLLKANYALLISDNQQIDSIKFSVLSNFD